MSAAALYSKTIPWGYMARVVIPHICNVYIPKSATDNAVPMLPIIDTPMHECPLLCSLPPGRPGISRIHPLLSARRPFSIILRQPCKRRRRRTTIKIPIPHFLRENPRLHAQLPTPLHRILRSPCPIKPAPTNLKTVHLRLRIHQQPLLIEV